MDKTVLMMDTGREVTLRTAHWLQKNGCRVIVLQKDHRDMDGIETVCLDLLDQRSVQVFADGLDGIDMLVLGVPPCEDDGPIGSGHNLNLMLDELVYFGCGTGNLLEACLPKFQNSMKRIGCITEPEGTHSLSCEAGNLLRHQMHAALHMLGKELFNKLRAEGFTFRWFCEGTKPGPMSAGEYLLSKLSYHPDEAAIHSDENRLVIRDGYLHEIPW